jgi:uncharacterized protein YqeY
MAAMRQKDAATVNPLKALLAAYNAREKSLQSSQRDGTALQKLSPDTILSRVIHHEIAKRKDSIDSFIKHRRTDLVAKEEHEMRVLQRYLEGSTSEEEIRALVEQAFEALRDVGLGANDPGSMSPGKIFRWLFEDAERKAKLGPNKCDQAWMRRIVIDEIKTLSDRPDGILEDLVKARTKNEDSHLQLSRYQ